MNKQLILEKIKNWIWVGNRFPEAKFSFSCRNSEFQRKVRNLYTDDAVVQICIKTTCKIPQTVRVSVSINPTCLRHVVFRSYVSIAAGQNQSLHLVTAPFVLLTPCRLSSREHEEDLNKVTEFRDDMDWPPRQCRSCPSQWQYFQIV